MTQLYMLVIAFMVNGHEVKTEYPLRDVSGEVCDELAISFTEAYYPDRYAYCYRPDARQGRVK